MTSAFTVYTSSHFERLFRNLRKKHPAINTLHNDILSILSSDPYNRSGKYSIKKLTGVKKGEGQYRLRLKRFRFRYDIDENQVLLKHCGLRREDTYK